MLAFALLFAVLMLLLYFIEWTRPPASGQPHDANPPLKFDDRPVGPWAKLAGEIAPRQRKTF